MRLILLLLSIYWISANGEEKREWEIARESCQEFGFYYPSTGTYLTTDVSNAVYRFMKKHPNHLSYKSSITKLHSLCMEMGEILDIKMIRNAQQAKEYTEEKMRERQIAPQKIEEFKALAIAKRSEIQKTEQKIQLLKNKMHEVEKAGKKPFKYFYQMYKSLGDGLYVCRLGTTGETFVLRDGSRLITNPRAGEFFGYLTRSGTMPLSKNGFPIEVAIFDLADEGTKPYQNWVENYAPKYDRHYENWDREEKKLKTLIKERNDVEQKQKYYSKLISKE